MSREPGEGLAPPVNPVSVLLTWGQTGSHTFVPRWQLVPEVSCTELDPHSQAPIFNAETNPH